MTSLTKPPQEPSRRSQLLKGLAELAVLSSMRDGPQYGLSILDRLKDQAGLDVAEGSIYPLLHRLERAGSIKAEWRLDEEGTRPRKYYVLTASGHRELDAATDEWGRISQALNSFLNRTVDHDRN
ncbi:helix-turn-helix transcriptional regulator [Dyella mobilis]|uniref:Helix-turn-helix transcriptional regulator n=2 Tax=Dyella mobilis TaxID=1849582 RepID=A0ABS2KF03_9GAMM|nr:helix-turn-helix transcriptional regulator [Dyella mobilis]